MNSSWSLPTVPGQTPAIFHRPGHSPIAQKKEENPAELKARILELQQENAKLRQKLEGSEKSTSSFSQKHISFLMAALAEVKNNTPIGKIIQALENNQEISDKFWNSQQKLDFTPQDKAVEIYKTAMELIQKDLDAFNASIAAPWNHVSLRLSLMDKISEWLIDSHGFPTNISNLLEKISAFKKELKPILKTDFLYFDAASIPKLKNDYQSLKNSFEKIEKGVLAIENDAEFPNLLKKMVDILNQKIDPSPSYYSALSLSRSVPNFKTEDLDHKESTRSIRENDTLNKEHERKLYRHLFEVTGKNWFELIIEATQLKSTLQCLGETIELMMPIRDLQTKNANTISLVSEYISAYRKTTKTTRNLDVEELKIELEKHKLVFVESLKAKTGVEQSFAGAVKRLEATNLSLSDRLTKQSALSKEIAFDVDTLANKIESLQKNFNHTHILVSNQLEIAWGGIANKLIETAWHLDRMDYGIYYGGNIPNRSYFHTAYKISSGQFYKMTQAGPVQEEPKALSIQSEGSDIDSIPTKVLLLDEDDLK